MPVSKKQQACVYRYSVQHYDRVNLMLKKGTKNIVQEFAATKGESLNGFINRAIAETMEREGATLPEETEGLD